MPYKEKKVEKLYYTVGEVSEIFAENKSLIRFWAEKFPEFIKPARNKKGNRLFSVKDLENFKIIHFLVKEQGMTLEGASKKMKDNLTGVDMRVEVINKLNAIKEQLQIVAASIEIEEEIV